MMTNIVYQINEDRDLVNHKYALGGTMEDLGKLSSLLISFDLDIYHMTKEGRRN